MGVDPHQHVPHPSATSSSSPLLSPGQRATWQPWMASGLSPSQRAPLSLPLHTTCRCWTPSPQVAEHCAQTDGQAVSDGVGTAPTPPTAPQEVLMTIPQVDIAFQYGVSLPVSQTPMLSAQGCPPLSHFQ